MKGRGSRGIAAGWLVAVVLVIALAAVASLYFIAGSATRGTSTSTATSTQTTSSFATSTSAQSPGDGLELSLVLNTTSLSSGQGVSATVEEGNPSGAVANVSSAAKWPLQGLTLGPCGTLNLPVGVAVMAGDYGLSNVSSATPLQLYGPGLTGCPAILAGIHGFVFRASSDNATVYGTCQPSSTGCFSETVETSVTFSGYWVNGSFESFPPGTYTVVAGDEWGALVMLHFQVV